MGHLCRFFWVSHKIIQTDYLTFFVPCSLYMVSLAFCVNPLDFNFILISVLKQMFLVIILLCLTDTHNQLSGIEEDRVNKPFRLLPSGRASVSEYRRHLLIYHVLACVYGLLTGAIAAVLIFCCGNILNNYSGLSRNWVIKNMANAIGFYACYLGALLMLDHSNDKATGWGVIIFANMFLLSSVQDFRDIIGDRRCGRLTLPMVLGELPTRALLACVVIGFSCLAISYWQTVRYFSVSLLVMASISALHLLLFRHARHLKTSHVNYCLWLCCFVLSPSFSMLK